MIEMYGNAVSKEESFNSIVMASHSGRLLKVLKSFYDTGELTDVVLVVDDEELSCHKNILAACSPYFRAMFTMDVTETTRGRVQLHGISIETLRLILDYIYTEQVYINNSNVQSLLTAANMMQLDDLVGLCVEHAKAEIDAENCVEVYQFADFNDLTELQSSSKRFIFDHFDDVLSTKALLSVPFTFLQELMTVDDLNTVKEEHVFELLEDWVNHDLENRCKYFPVLFELVRLPLIEQAIRISLLATNALIQNHPQCREKVLKLTPCKVINDSTGDAHTTEGRNANHQRSCKLRKGMHTRKLLIFSGGANSDSKRSFTCYYPDTKRNYVGIEQPSPHDYQYKMEHFKLIVVNDSATYFLGGVLYEKQQSGEQCHALSNVYKYAQQERTWVSCSRMNKGRCSFAACSYHERIYVFGGVSSHPHGDVIDHVEFYDVISDVWQPVQPMPVGISHQTATTFVDSIYMFGGLDDEQAYLNTVLLYSILRDTWTLVETELIRPRVDATAITYREKIYVLGGADKHEHNITMEIYDPIRNRWSYGDKFPEERKLMAITLCNDYIYVCGGFKFSTTRPGHYRRSRTVETRDLHKFDLRNGQWRRDVNIVQYGSSTCCASTVVNINYLSESDFISEE